MNGRLLASSLILGLALLACRGETHTPPATGADGEHATPPPGAAAENAEKPVAAPDDPRGAAERADLARLCAALDHDYIDGTLSDYYGEVEPGTKWGKEVREAGNEADLPGRHLQEEAKAFTQATGEAMPEACTKLFAQLEDLE